jgi:hypothetical protein
MNKEFIPYEESLALKELGFDEPCFGYYTGDKMHLVIRPLMLRANELESYVVTAPTYSQAFRFFREKYRLQPSVNSFCFEEYSFVIMGSRNEILYPIQHKLLNDGKKNPWEFDTYEEAELACLKKLIQIVKNK